MSGSTATSPERSFPWTGECSHLLHHLHPEPFSGRALDWFTWAEMFYATVHHTRRSVAEKLVCLKASLKKSHPNLVIGAGEPAYKDGLRRLKEECGKRTVIRAALAYELKTISIPRDPAGFKRAALEIRTYMFELSRIGELSNTDYIDHICQKMGQNDLLAWNSERDTGLERRTLIQFGDWLCKRADAYQSTYGMAAINGGGAPRNNPGGGGGGGGGGNHSKPHHHGRSNKATTGVVVVVAQQLHLLLLHLARLVLKKRRDRSASSARERTD